MSLASTEHLSDETSSIDWNRVSRVLLPPAHVSSWSVTSSLNSVVQTEALVLPNFLWSCLLATARHPSQPVTSSTLFGSRSILAYSSTVVGSAWRSMFLKPSLPSSISFWVQSAYRTRAPLLLTIHWQLPRLHCKACSSSHFRMHRCWPVTVEFWLWLWLRQMMRNRYRST